MEVLDLNNHNGLGQNGDNASCTTSSTGLRRGTGQPIPPGSPLPPSLQAHWRRFRTGRDTKRSTGRGRQACGKQPAPFSMPGGRPSQ